MIPTPVQRQAADPGRSCWVVANAGTGKTRVLTDRILRLLLFGADPEGILAITFTRAAAREMVARIEARLRSWATEDEEALRRDLEGLVGGPPEAAVLQRARGLFARILELPQGLRIDTIHAFCTGLLRRFPIEAGVAPHFRTLDEGKARELFAEARDRVLEEAASQPDGPLGRALAFLGAERADQGLFGLLDELRPQRLRLLELRAACGGSTAVLCAELARRFDLPPGRPPEQLLKEACADGAFDAVRLDRIAEVLAADTTERRRRAGERLKAWLRAAPEERPGRVSELLDALFTKEGTPRRELFGPRSRPALDGALAEALERELARWQEVRERMRAAEGLLRTDCLLRLGYAILDQYEALKAREAVLDFEDLVARAAELLAQERVPWVLFKLDQRLEHLLVDEAQDTSPRQWQVIEALLGEFLAGEGAHEGLRTFFVVGDDKQSIYSFQGADVDNFRAAQGRLGARAEAAGHPFADLRLNRSFRSTEAVLSVVDQLYARVPEVRAGVVAEEAVLEHEVHRLGEAGRVELWPLALPRVQTAPQEPWALPEPQPNPDPKPRLAQAIARTIARWLAEGEILEARGRPLAPGDILILLQTRSTLQELLVRALKREGVPVAGVDRMRLGDHLAVQDLVALGRAVLLPEDDYSLACLLKSPLIGLEEEELFQLAHDRGDQSLIQRLARFAETDGGRFREAFARFRAWQQRADFTPPYEFYLKVLGADGGRERLCARLGEDAAEPIEAFLAQALAFEEGHAASLEGFLHWFQFSSGELVRDPHKHRDAVRVVTVHGAKGLEAPVVILADATDRPRHRESDPLVWLDDGMPFWRGREQERPEKVARAVERERRREAEERNRLLYVALTRAEDRLYATGWLERQQASQAASGNRPLAPDSWYAHLHTILEGKAVEVREADSFGKGFAGEWLIYRCGSARTPRQHPSPPAPESAPLPEWIRRPAPKETARRPHAPSTLAGSAGEDNEGEPVRTLRVRAAGGERAQRRGLMLHRLLEHLPGLSRERWREAARRLFPEEEPERLAELVEEAARILDHPELRPVFAADAFVEQEIVGEVDGEPVQGRIDRFALTPHGVVLVDFKSHQSPPDRPPPAVVAQIRAYGRLLQQLYPDRAVRAAVVWTANGRVDWIPVEPPEARSSDKF